MFDDKIVIRGAREHNLKNIDLDLPKNKLIVFTGVSGSGKSSLAFDTLYAEGQRRYVESLSAYARQFLGQMDKPDVDFIGGLSPAISIDQKSTSNNPRSTVATITEIYDYLRLLLARAGTLHCYKCDRQIGAQTTDEIVDQILSLDADARIQILAPIVRGRKGEYKDEFANARKLGFVRVRVDGQIFDLSEEIKLDKNQRHNIEIVVDRLAIKPNIRSRLVESVETALKIADGDLIVNIAGDEDKLFSKNYACVHCNLSFPELTPQMFSFNSPQGMCPSCHGLGTITKLDPDLVVPDKSLSINKGAIKLWGVPSSLHIKHILNGLTDHYGFSLNEPWCNLTKEQQQAILFGSGGQRIRFTYVSFSGRRWPYEMKFQGVIPIEERKYHQSKSEIARLYYAKYMNSITCHDCKGSRLRAEVRSVKVGGQTIFDVVKMSIDEGLNFLENLNLTQRQQIIVEDVLKEIKGRLRFLMNVGLHYLTLDRSAPSLAGGEAQRIRLASQIGAGLVGVLYILDEPSIGLHARDNKKLLDSLKQLKNLGNTVIVVEHDEETIWESDYVVDFGPGAGVKGGEIVAFGTASEISNNLESWSNSLTAQYLSGKKQIPIPQYRRPIGGKWLEIVGAKQNNLKNINVKIPLGVFTCVTGVSGSGKSSLVSDILYKALARDLMGANTKPGAYHKIIGTEHLDKVINIDQDPIGRTPRSNPATYVKLFDLIRDLYSQLPESKVRGYKPGRFSFNVEGGRCEACEGNGYNQIEMHFLADVWVKCEVCQGKRYKSETLEVKYKGKSIAEVLEMDVQEALNHFENIPKIVRILKTLHDVGLDYIKLGQPAPTLSGGEAQRVKLAKELCRTSTGKTLYILDEPTTGLHFEDVKKLLDLLHRLVDSGNSVVVIEHNMEVIKTADYIIDLGPEGGDLGGWIVAWGTPEDLAESENSYTGAVLKNLFRRYEDPINFQPLMIKEDQWAGASPALTTYDYDSSVDVGVRAGQARPLQAPARSILANKISIRGAKEHNLKNIDVDIPHRKLTAFTGVSGSGKTSLALDTIYAEGQRRYVESLSAYARQFLGQLEKPKVDKIEGLAPSIAIEQKTPSINPRSTVGTVTEIYDYLRVLYARVGIPHCPKCNRQIGVQSSQQIVDRVLTLPSESRIYLLSPVKLSQGEDYQTSFLRAQRDGFVRVWIDRNIRELSERIDLDKRIKHEVGIVVDRMLLRAENRSRLAEGVEIALNRSGGEVSIYLENSGEIIPFSQHFACVYCGLSFKELIPQSFSFNNPLGWCNRCNGLGIFTENEENWEVYDSSHSSWRYERNWRYDRERRERRERERWERSQFIEDLTCPECNGTRIRPEAAAVTLKSQLAQASRLGHRPSVPPTDQASTSSPSPLEGEGWGEGEISLNNTPHSSPLPQWEREYQDKGEGSIVELAIWQATGLTIAEVLKFFENLLLGQRQQEIAKEILREVKSRLRFLVDVGLSYLTLARPAPTLSGGEAQRIRLASQLGSGLTGVLYVLDEPSIGLHPRDTNRLLKALKHLRDLGNSVIVVEHDPETILNSDFLIDFGPGAGTHGGEVVAVGSPEEVKHNSKSLTGGYLKGALRLDLPEKRREGKGEWLEVSGAKQNNLKNISVKIPLGTFTCVTGVSGSGKSSLVEDILYKALAKKLNKANEHPGKYDTIKGINYLDKAINIDQKPIGSTPRSNPATYVDVFTDIRKLYAELPDSKVRGFDSRRFSFNLKLGQCEACSGHGYNQIEMHFLADVWVKCESCKGTGYNKETLEIRYKGKNIAEVLDMTAKEALNHFQNFPKIKRMLKTLCDVGLDYIQLGQSANTLSGGESQRVKLAKELSKRSTGRTIYIMDEPTTGLHFDDIKKLLSVLNRLVEKGNTVVVIEHNLDVIKYADYIIDLGPEGGDMGGYIVACDTPEEIVKVEGSYTGRFLKVVLERDGS